MPDLRAKNGGRRKNAGRKTKAEELGLVALLDECWTVASRKATIKKLASLASKGNLEAIKLLMAYTFGKPKETVAVEANATFAIVRVPSKAASREEWERQQKEQTEE